MPNGRVSSSVGCKKKYHKLQSRCAVTSFRNVPTISRAKYRCELFIWSSTDARGERPGCRWVIFGEKWWPGSRCPCCRAIYQADNVTSETQRVDPVFRLSVITYSTKAKRYSSWTRRLRPEMWERTTTQGAARYFLCSNHIVYPFDVYFLSTTLFFCIVYVVIALRL